MQDEEKVAESSRLLPLNSDLSDEGQFMQDPSTLAQPNYFNGRARRKILLKR